MRRRRPGRKQRLVELGPRGSPRWLRDSPAVGVTDTTFRDAHQSLLATRVRTSGLLAVAPYIARLTPQLLSMECWGGATYDVALRFLKEDPWERLAALREAVPNICLQMLLRGRNTVGYTPYPELVTSAFVEEATATGIDIFRIFDALNNVESMRPAIDAVRETGTAVAEVAMCYTGDLSDPGRDALHAGLLPASWPSRSSRPARTCWRSRTWPGCCGRRPPTTLVSRAAQRGSTCRCTCTPTTPPAGSWPPTWRPGRPAPTRSTARPRRWPAPPASPR